MISDSNRLTIYNGSPDSGAFMAKARKVLSDGDLIAYSKELVQYEISMLVACGRLSTRQFRSESAELAEVLHNAILESFAIHLRNIVDFLYPGVNVKLTDVLRCN